MQSVAGKPSRGRTAAAAGSRPAGPGRAAVPGARPRVGVLSLQGDFALHASALAELGCEPVHVSRPEHLDALVALVLPGGESSTMLRLLDSSGLRAPLERAVRELPVLATCAGLILLGREADKLPRPTFGVLDVDTKRNAWGRQVHSFVGPVSVPALGGDMQGVFIRAPRIMRLGPGVQVVARLADEPVGVRQGRMVALAFHPELTVDRRLHAWFLRDVAGIGLEATP